MTREDIHEAAKNDPAEGSKPGDGQGGQTSEAGSGFGGAHETGADAVPESTTGVNDPDVEQPG